MKRLLCGAAVAAALFVSASPLSAQVVNMTATLTGAEETTATPGVLGQLTGAVFTLADMVRRRFGLVTTPDIHSTFAEDPWSATAAAWMRELPDCLR